MYFTFQQFHCSTTNYTTLIVLAKNDGPSSRHNRMRYSAVLHAADLTPNWNKIALSACKKAKAPSRPLAPPSLYYLSQFLWIVTVGACAGPHKAATFPSRRKDWEKEQKKDDYEIAETLSTLSQFAQTKSLSLSKSVPLLRSSVADLMNLSWTQNMIDETGK